MNHDRRVWLYIFLSMQLVLALVRGNRSGAFSSNYLFLYDPEDTDRHIVE